MITTHKHRGSVNRVPLHWWRSVLSGAAGTGAPEWGTARGAFGRSLSARPALHPAAALADSRAAEETC